MIVTDKHDFHTSFELWLDNYVLTHGQAYQNLNNQPLFRQERDRFFDDQFLIYNSPYKQIVSDISISGANIPYFFLDGTTPVSKTSGIYIDYKEGRVIIDPTEYTPSNNLTMSLSVKDFNIYYTNQIEEDFLYDANFNWRNFYGTIPQTGIEPYDQVAPAIFINDSQTKNENFVLGGLNQTTYLINCFLLSKNHFDLDGLISILRDSKDVCFKKISTISHPMNEYGDCKIGFFYDYSSLNSIGTYTIQDVFIENLPKNITQNIARDAKMALAEFKIIEYRQSKL